MRKFFTGSIICIMLFIGCVDIEPPEVNITNPINGEVVSGTVSIIAEATDNIWVKKVDFYINDSLVSTSCWEPYVYSWVTTSLPDSSSHTIYAKAYDVAGNEGISSTITVIVYNGGGSGTGIHITSSPAGAKIYLWGQGGEICKWTQVTPHTFTDLTPGQHGMILSADDYYEWHAIGYEPPVVVEGEIDTVNAVLLQKFSQGINIALQSNGATATASSWASYGGYNATPDQANDGTANIEQSRTFWAATPLPSWLKITLPSTQSVKTIVVHPYYHDLTIDIEGTTGGSWFSLVPSTFLAHTAQIFNLSKTTQVLEVRVNVTNSTAPGSHLWKTPIYELELWQY